MHTLGTPDQPTFGLDTFGDVSVRPDGSPQTSAEAIRDVVAEGVLADEVGVDYIGVGEHHRADFSVSAPDLVLAAIAGQTKRIRLGTAVTVLSSDDPVRIFQRFSTLDAASSGRAEITLGRGSFTESFPLFGYSLADYEVLFAEKLDLFVKLLEERPLTWHGTLRAPLESAELFPKTESGNLPTWIGVGGTPQSVVRAAAYGLPLVVAVIGGSPSRFVPLLELYRQELASRGLPRLPISMHVPGHIAATDEQAKDEHFAPHRDAFAKIGRERGWGAPMTRSDYEATTGPQGAYFVGSPETVAQKIVWALTTLGLSRIQIKYSVGALPHALRLESIRLYGQEVIPRVRELLAIQT
jgi:probable LLM family oxidoreductase